MVGAIKAVGRPVEEIRVESEKRLAEYVRDAKVSVLPVYTNRRFLQDVNLSVLAQLVQPRRVAVIGEVGVMGLIDLKSGARVIDALVQAQVNRSTAAINSVVVVRNPTGLGGKPRYRRVRLEDFLEGRAPLENVALRNGDIVIVPKTEIAKVNEFIDLFFARTLPVFQWWGVAWESSVSRQKTETTRLINEALRRNLDSVVITPNPGR
jgi:protein involved in polysaccharide export with SLBB domain